MALVSLSRAEREGETELFGREYTTKVIYHHHFHAA